MVAWNKLSILCLLDGRSYFHWDNKTISSVHRLLASIRPKIVEVCARGSGIHARMSIALPVARFANVFVGGELAVATGSH